MKKILFSLFLFVVSLVAFSQTTSLEVDCQNPGWLSNKIAYGDQKTIQNLKLTGYINADDLTFIGEMISKQSLRGSINLEGVNIVGKTTSEDNVMPKNAFNIQWSADYPKGLQISEIIFPLSLRKSTNCLSSELYIEKITIGGESMPSVKGEDLYDISYSGGDGVRFNGRVKHLILREGVTEIPERAFYNKNGVSKENCRFESVTFPTTLKTIGKAAFFYCHNLSFINLTDYIEEIGDEAFYKTAYRPDTLNLPKNLKKYHTRAFNIPKVIYFDSAIENINNWYQTYNNSYNMYYDNDYIENNDVIEIHLKTTVPPSFLCHNENVLSKCTIYVPNTSISNYQNAKVWKYATILAEPVHAVSIEITNDSLELCKGEKKQLEAIVLPTDADSTEFTWSSTNPDIVSVSSSGMVTANSSGEAFIISTLNADNTIIDSCKIKVFQPVTTIVLNTKEKSLKVGETYTLIPTVNPNDADNKNIIWTSENSEIATIENGTIKALKAGVTKITATSEDNNNATDYCEVIVTQPATGIILNYSECKLEGIGAMIQLEASIIPEDATNKNINWRSSNESICIVSNGKVVSVGFGTAVIIATTVDGGHMATCTVVVENNTRINKINETNEVLKVFDINGNVSSLESSGIKIIRFEDGSSMKILIK